MEKLFDIHYTCEPYESLGSISKLIEPECYTGLKLDFNKQHKDSLITGHYLSISQKMKRNKQIIFILFFMLQILLK